MDLPHRKRVKHYDDASHVREITFSCYQRMNLLTNDEWRAMLSESIGRAIKGHAWNLTAFVYMPNHVHLILFPSPSASKMEALLSAIKRPFSFRIKKLLEAAHSPLLTRLTIRQRPKVFTFRFWQEGPGYDRNLDTESAVLNAIDYVHRNPVRKEFVTTAAEWKWSSANWYLNPTQPLPAGFPPLTSIPAEW